MRWRFGGGGDRDGEMEDRGQEELVPELARMRRVQIRGETDGDCVTDPACEEEAVEASDSSDEDGMTVPPELARM
jgi:hypothetical protein